VTYDEAFKEACSKAVQNQRDYGIEKNAFGFSTFMLPDPKNRCGHELRCEVVTIELAKAFGGSK